MSEPIHIPVCDVMTSNPIVIDGLATVAQAVELLRKHNISSLVIGKRHECDEYGVLTVGDIAEHIVSTGRSPDRVNVYEIMSKPAVSVDTNMDIKYAVRLLMRFGLSRALVLDKGAVTGIVTLRDLTLRSISVANEKPAEASE